MTMMTNEEIWRVALEQSAIDCNCAPEDLLRTENAIAAANADPRARVYLPRPVECEMVSYGSNVVAQVSERVRAAVTGYVNAYPASRAFETPHIYVLNEALRPFGLAVCYIAEYFLPDVTALRALDCPYELRLLGPEGFAGLYKPEWSNALCADRKERDMLALGAYDGDTLVGLAGVSADCEADRRGRAAGVPPPGRGLGADQPAGAGGVRPGQSPLLLRGLVQSQERAQRP